MSDILNKINFRIRCPKCKQFPIIYFPIEDENSVIQYKCHSHNYEKINLKNFMNLFLFYNCLLCEEKGDYKCFCGIFCKYDYLYHILTSKHNIQSRIYLNDNNIFEYFCFDCDKKYLKQLFKNKEHNNHNFIRINELLKKYKDYKLLLNPYIQINVQNKINDIINSIYYISSNYFERGYFKYITNLENLITSMKKNNNFIIADFMINDTKKNIKIVNYNDEEQKIELENDCDIFVNNEKQKFNCSFQFNNKENRINLFFHKLKTTTNSLFDYCNKLISVDLSNFNNKKVINMSHMFDNCFALRKINLSNINTNNVKDMSYIFSNCSSLNSLDLSNFNTHKVTNMSYMFFNCYSLNDLDLSNFNTNNVEDMSFMFFNCSSLYNLNLSNFNTNNVKDMNYIFSHCSSLSYLNISNFNINNGCEINFIFLKINKKCNIITEDKSLKSELNQ